MRATYGEKKREITEVLDTSFRLGLPIFLKLETLCVKCSVQALTIFDHCVCDCKYPEHLLCYYYSLSLPLSFSFSILSFDYMASKPNI